MEKEKEEIKLPKGCFYNITYLILAILGLIYAHKSGFFDIFDVLEENQKMVNATYSEFFSVIFR